MQSTNMIIGLLGKSGSQESLWKPLEPVGVKADAIFRRAEKPYPVSFPEQGATVMMQFLTPELENDMPGGIWGLHSIHLEKGSWRSKWLKEWSPEESSIQKVIDVLAKQQKEAMMTPDVACFTLEGDEGKTWSMVALFEAGGKRLKTMIVTRMEDWIRMSELEKTR